MLQKSHQAIARQNRHEMTELQTNNEEVQHTTAVWRKGGCSATYDSFVVGSSLVLRLKFCAKNPPLRQPAKRCTRLIGTI